MSLCGGMSPCRNKFVLGVESVLGGEWQTAGSKKCAAEQIEIRSGRIDCVV